LKKYRLTPQHDWSVPFCESKDTADRKGRQRKQGGFVCDVLGSGADYTYRRDIFLEKTLGKRKTPAGIHEVGEASGQ
jgi:hypothetical protein